MTSQSLQMVATYTSASALATTSAWSGLRPSYGGPGTPMGQEQPLVCICDHAFKNETLNLAPFKIEINTPKTIYKGTIYKGQYSILFSEWRHRYYYMKSSTQNLM